MNIDQLYVPMAPLDVIPADQAIIFQTQPIIALDDAVPVRRGEIAQFIVESLDGADVPFSVHAKTLDSTGTVANGDYFPIDADYNFVGSGVIGVQTGSTTSPDDVEFLLKITANNNSAFAVRSTGTARIIAATIVSTFSIYDDGVYAPGIYLKVTA